jgi:hypothetical protein
MPVWRNTDPRFLARAALLLLALATSLARADFKIATLDANLSDQTLIVNGELDLGLSPKVEEALSKGIELPLTLEIRLYQKRSWWWDRRVSIWTLRRNLQYHALTGQYLVAAEGGGDSFLSLPNALRALGRLNELRLPLSQNETLDRAREYSVRLRVHLDIEALPAPLRPVAYTNLSWHLNSGWSEWNIAPLD